MISAEQFEELINGNPFDRQMKFKLLKVKPGYTEITMTCVPGVHDNRRGTVHGGAIVSMADTCMGTACFTLGKAVSTIDINGNYVRPIQNDETLIMKSQVEHNGHSTIVVTTKFYNKKDKLVFTGRGTFWVMGPYEVHPKKKGQLTGKKEE